MNRRLLIAAALIAVIVISCGKGKGKQPAGSDAVTSAVTVIDKGFSKFIAAYTTGVVPAGSSLQVVFTPEFAATMDRSRTQGLFTFTPSVRGDAEWADDVTLVFKPSRPLSPGTSFQGTLDLSKLGQVEERFRFFPLIFRTVEKNFTVTVNPVTVDLPDGNTYSVTGTVVTSDQIDKGEVEKYLTARVGKRDEKIVWDHDNKNIHTFSIEKISRAKEESELTLAWNGTAYGIKTKGEHIVAIPAEGVFAITDIKINTGDSKSLEIFFSDLLDAGSELDGLVTLTPSHPLSVSAGGNRLLVIPGENIIGTVEVTVDGSLRNSRGQRLGEAVKRTINFTPVEPGIQPVGRGVIMPSSGSLIFPFLAANLSAIDLTIIKVFENNLPYFLQQNSMGEGNYYDGNISQFGRPVYRGRVDLTGNTGFDPNKFNLFTIDLADYIEPEQGILYRIELGMRPSYSLYPCTGERKPSKYEEMLELADLDRRWEGSDDYYSLSEEGLFYEYAYNWRDSKNPCSDAYFSPNKNLVSNILASDLGIIAKSGPDDNLRIFVRDLRTAEPVEGATAEVFDYQMQTLGTVTTDKSGMAALACPRKPFLVIARKDKNRNYLSLKDGAALSMSSFDVSGETPVDGIRAFLFTERDVRRPGDSIFVGVIVRDAGSGLPAGHPVHYELYNTKGQRIDQQVTTLNDKGFLTFASVTTDDAETGNYRAQVRIGAATFTRIIKVETVKPNRLKIKLDFPDAIAGGDNKTMRGAMKVTWLNGTTARDMKSTVELLLKPVKTTFDKYGQYSFDDPAAQFWFDSQTVFDGNINSSGEAVVSFTPDDELQAPGMLNAIFTTRVFEKGGDASINQTVLPYAPYPSFVGMNIPALGATGRILFTDRPNEVRVVTVDKNGKPVRSEVEINVYKLDYRWWWESDDEYLGSYISRDRNNNIFSEKIATTGGEGKVSFSVDKQKWGRYLVRATLPSGHSTGMIVLVDWPWDYGMKPGGNDGASLLQLNTDKDKYSAGDDISLTFPAPENGRAIITIENSTGLLDIKEISTQAGNTEVKVKATKAMAPNAYLYVTMLQPHSQTVNDAPIRLYGVIPVMVEDPSSKLVPVITVPDQIRSRQEVEIRIEEQNRREMTYTLAVVDEGLLDLTGFRTPDPWKWFFVKHALGVRTWDLYDIVFGAFGGKLGRAFAIGGSEAAVDQSKNRARRFEPVVRFIGPFTLAPGRTGTHKIRLPQYTGSVRVMITAAGEGNTFGSAEKSVIVSDPLMILATAPRVLSPGDKVALPVTVFAQKKDISDVSVTATGNEMVSFTQASGSVRFVEPGDKDLELLFTAAQQPGKAEIKVSAEGGGESASYDLVVPVRSPNPPERRAETITLAPGDKYLKTFAPFGLAGTSSASVEIFSLPSVNLSGRLGYLTSFPHGCTEQITSAAFPQVYLPDLLGSGLPDPAAVRNNVQEALRSIATRQLSSGALTLWPGAPWPDDWVTSYAGHFAIEAQKAGYALPAAFLSKWTAYQRSTAAAWRYQPQYRYTANDQAYRLFTMALAGAPDKGAMNRMREVTDLPSLARWFLAAAYATTGRPEVAQSLTDVRNLKTEDEFMHYYYGSGLRDQSIILYTLTTIGNTTEALELLKQVAESLSQDRWYSTQTTAWGLFAYMNFSKKLKGDNSRPVKVAFDFNGKKEKISSDGGAIMRSLAPAASNTLVIENESDKPVFVTFTEQGVPQTSDMTVTENNLTMKVEYTDMEQKPVDISSMAQGTGFMMVVSVTNTTFRQLGNLALTKMMPSGWEIQNTRLFEAGLALKESGYDYRDFRDDRVCTYFSLKPGETKKFFVMLTASYRGTYSQPAIVCEAMYDEGVLARRPGREVIVRQ
ncbi:MAG: MG2 domain-containing protein [Bacteroidales bacterium]